MRHRNEDRMMDMVLVSQRGSESLGWVWSWCGGTMFGVSSTMLGRRICGIAREVLVCLWLD